MSTPNIVISEFHPVTGALLSNVSILSYGRITNGTHSRVKVFNISFANVTKVGNLRIGLIADAGITVNPNQTIVQNTDGTSATGYFGIRYSSNFDSSIASEPLATHFAGLNTDTTASNSNNVFIPMSSNTVSNYIYLDVEAGSGIGAGNGAYKLFYDFS